MTLDLSQLHPDPLQQFQSWYEDALKLGLKYPDAMTLATCTRSGRPSARTVLFKRLSREGFQFFTNYESQKGAELAKNTAAALVFYWEKLDRQVRVEGITKKLPRKESLAYFRSRPRGSQIGAWVSRQSQVIPDRAFLEKRLQEFEKKFMGKEVPLPPYWGGFVLVPNLIEFWSEGEFRLHDRFRYTKPSKGKGKGKGWKVVRLSP
jgi:pyridoxamine 5'-phosphate oxidase